MVAQLFKVHTTLQTVQKCRRSSGVQLFLLCHNSRPAVTARAIQTTLKLKRKWEIEQQNVHQRDSNSWSTGFILWELRVHTWLSICIEALPIDACDKCKFVSPAWNTQNSLYHYIMDDVSALATHGHKIRLWANQLLDISLFQQNQTCAADYAEAYYIISRATSRTACRYENVNHACVATRTKQSEGHSALRWACASAMS